jgi:hypothetical protein
MRLSARRARRAGAPKRRRTARVCRADLHAGHACTDVAEANVALEAGASGVSFYLVGALM